MTKSTKIAAMTVAVIVFAAAFSAPVVACEATQTGPSRPPAIGALIDAIMPTAALSDADRARVADLRSQIKALAASGRYAEARQREVEAMLLLGYRRAFLHCGPGSGTIWVKMKVSPGS